MANLGGRGGCWGGQERRCKGFIKIYPTRTSGCFEFRQRPSSGRLVYHERETYLDSSSPLSPPFFSSFLSPLPYFLTLSSPLLSSSLDLARLYCEEFAFVSRCAAASLRF